MFKNILVPVDVSVPSEAQGLLNATMALSASWSAQLHVVAVVPSVGMPIVGSYFDDDFESRRLQEAKSQLAQAVDAAGMQADQHVVTGKVYDSVINLAASLGVDLIVIGAHQPGLGTYLLGSNAARVVRHSSQSVMVLRSQADHKD